MTLNWVETSTNETGFKIERGPTVAGPWGQIDTAPVNATGYVNGGLPDATTFCYRVRAYNSGGDGAFSNIACAKTRATLAIVKAGNGAGVISSQPAGIDCGAVCTVDALADIQITLSAAPAAGSTFAGWSGACTGTGGCVVTMNAAKSVTATFDAIAPPNGSVLNLTVQ